MRPSLSEASAELPSRRYAWTVVVLMAAAAFINYLDRSSIGVAMPAMRGELHLDPHQQGRAFAAVLWTYTLMQLPIGWLVDRFSLKWLYAASFGLWSVAAAATGLVNGYAFLLLTRVFLGVGEAIYLPGGLKAVSETFPPEKRALPSGLFDFGSKLGIALGIYIDAWIVQHWGWRTLFFRTGGLGLIWLIPWLWLYRTPRNAKHKSASRFSAPVANRAAMRALDWRALLRNRTVFAISIGFFCYDYFWYLLVFWLPSYLHDARHFDFSQLKFVASLPFVVVGVASTCGGFLLEALQRWGVPISTATKLLVASGLAIGLLIIPAGYVHGASTAVVLICVVCVIGIAIPGMLLVPQYCAPFDEIALWVGIQNFWGNVGGIIAPDLTGYLIKRTGSYMPGFYCCAFVLVGALVAYTLVLPKLQPPAEIRA